MVTLHNYACSVHCFLDTNLFQNACSLYLDVGGQTECLRLIFGSILWSDLCMFLMVQLGGKGQQTT